MCLPVWQLTRLPFHLSFKLAGGGGLSGCLSSLVSQFTCPPVWLAVPGSPDIYLPMSPNPCDSSQSGWWCPALWMSLFVCLPIQIWFPVWLVVPSTCLPIQFFSRSGRWCPAFRLSVLLVFHFTCFPFWQVASGSFNISLRLFPNVAGVSGCLSSLAGGIRLPSLESPSGWWCPAPHLICFPVCLLFCSCACGVWLCRCLS